MMDEKIIEGNYNNVLGGFSLSLRLSSKGFLLHLRAHHVGHFDVLVHALRAKINGNAHTSFWQHDKFGFGMEHSILTAWNFKIGNCILFNFGNVFLFIEYLTYALCYPPEQRR
jgi:hypothetical protein